MPGWNSLQTVQSIHAWLEIGALGFFAALVVCEWVAHGKDLRRSEKIGLACFAVAILLELAAYPYGKRSDKLASLRIAELNERASANEREAARLRKLAEEESLARLQLESEVAWRRISKDSQSTIASRLVRFSGQMAQISFSAADLEAEGFALDIASALRAARWEALEPQAISNMRQVLIPLGTNAPLESGLTVTSTRDRISCNAAEAVVHQLSVLGFDATLSPTRYPHPTPTVFIFVEHRPEGAQGEFKLREQKKPKQ